MLGFDGATWNVVNAMLKEGLLPNIGKAMDAGVYARLQTPEPPYTPIIWTTIYTGANQEKHGIRNFFNTANDIRVPRIWDILVHCGRTAGVVGNYFTHPINKRLSFCIPSHFDAGTEVYPERYSFLRKLTKEMGLRKARLGTLTRSGLSSLRNGLSFRSILLIMRSVLATAFNRTNLNVYYRFQRIFMDMWFDVFLHVYRRNKADFTSFYTPIPDTICHRYWSFHEPEKFEELSTKRIAKYKDVIRNTYRHCDRLVGRVLKAMPLDTRICILSDHGFKAMADPGGMTVVVPEKLLAFLRLKGSMVVTNLGHQLIFQPKTDEIAERVLKLLQQAYVCDRDVPVFRNFDISKGINTIRCILNPGPLKKLDTRIFLDGKEIAIGEIAKTGSPWTGMHDLSDGLFILSGPGVSKDGEKSIIDAVDIMPTLLRLHGIDITGYCDGKIREDLIDENWAKENSAKVIQSYDSIPFRPEQETRADEEEIADRLKSLGYM
jgi:hypothetical protein